MLRGLDFVICELDSVIRGLDLVDRALDFDDLDHDFDVREVESDRELRQIAAELTRHVLVEQNAPHPI